MVFSDKVRRLPLLESPPLAMQTVINDVAYYSTESITTVKSFEAPATGVGESAVIRHHECQA